MSKRKTFETCFEDFKRIRRWDMPLHEETKLLYEFLQEYISLRKCIRDKIHYDVAYYVNAYLHSIECINNNYYMDIVVEKKCCTEDEVNEELAHRMQIAAREVETGLDSKKSVKDFFAQLQKEFPEKDPIKRMQEAYLLQ